MRYEVHVSDPARDQMFEIPGEHRATVETHLNRLRIAPVTLSRPSTPPRHPAGWQVYEFSFVDDGHVHRYAILFCYMDDECHLWIHLIGYESSPVP